jgi:hypothetical protein
MSQGKPFSSLPQAHVSRSFKEALYYKITILERRAARLRMSLLTLLSLSSFTGFVASCVYIWNTVMSSGFGEYVSLAFSDSAALAFSKDLGLSIVESLPALGIALALTAALISAWSLWSFLRVVKSRMGSGVAFA